MGSWRDFREPDLITFYKQLHAVDSVTSQVIGNCPCNFHRTLKGFIRHGMRLPGLPVIAILLAVTDRVAERDPIAVTNGQQRDLIVKVDRKSTRLNSSHVRISYAVFCLKKKKKGGGRQ